MLLKAKDAKQIHAYRMNRVRADAPNAHALLLEAFGRIRKLEILCGKQQKAIATLEEQVHPAFAEHKRKEHQRGEE